jgi:cytochrome c biogenesis protein CcmG, thiol:disulfide interchange protein DsbE
MNRTLLLAAITLVLPTSALAARKDAAPVPAPAFHASTPMGAVDSDSLRGQTVLLDFWASWCVPCRRSFPWMTALHEKYAARGLKIIAVNLDKEQKLADAFLAQYPAPFAIAFDPAGRIAEAYKVTAMPTTFLISSDGRILARHPGFDAKKAAAFEEEIQEALPR